MKIYDESAYCSECNCVITTQELLFNNGLCDNCADILSESTELEDNYSEQMRQNREDWHLGEYEYLGPIGFKTAGEYR